MAWVRKVGTDIKCVLRPEHLVGRSPRSSLQLPSNYVSAQHATFRWVYGAWEIKDLGSRNGTLLDGKPLPSGQTARLVPGLKISFGHVDETWEVADTSSPRPMLVSDGAEPPVELESEIVALPSQDHPEVTILCGEDGVWSIEKDDELKPLRDGALVVLNERQWRFSHPQSIADTALAGSPRDSRNVLRDFHLRFSVSRDEEHVELALERGAETIPMGSRNHNYLLLTLARQRLLEGGESVAQDGGWMYQDELLEALKTDREQLNIDVFRIRKQFQAVGILDAGSIIERRAATRQIRIGGASLSIQML